MRDLTIPRPPHRTPPPGGLEAVVREARHRLRVRAVESTAALAVAALVVTALPDGARRDGAAVIEPAERATATAPGTTPSAAPDRATATPARGTVAGPARGTVPGPRPTAASEDPGSPPDPLEPSPAPEPKPGRRPPVERTYESRVVGGELCGDDATGKPNEWCGYLWFDETAEVLEVRACRDARMLEDGTFTFDARNEADFVVRDAEGRVAWRWSDGAANPADPHTLTVDSGACYVWSVRPGDVSADVTSGWSVTAYVFAGELGTANRWTERVL
jgi:hypothetical protein